MNYQALLNLLEKQTPKKEKGRKKETQRKETVQIRPLRLLWVISEKPCHHEASDTKKKK